jgi:hypothetical protein
MLLLFIFPRPSAKKTAERKGRGYRKNSILRNISYSNKKYQKKEILMRQMLRFILLTLTSILVSSNVWAQAASATWALTADEASVVAGNVTAPAQTLTDTMSVRDYTGGAVGGIAERIWRSPAYWNTRSSQDPALYIEYSISPTSGNNLTVQSITLNIGCFGTVGHMFANIYCSTDPTFATSTKLNSSALTLPDVRTALMTALSYTPTTTVNDGQTFYLRVYPWYNTTPSVTKYVCLTNVVISGSTAPSGTTSLAVFPTSLSFGDVNINSYKDKSYNLSGTLLSPESGDITITAPAGFAVSTTGGSGFSSSINVPYSGGTLSATTIYVRFTPPEILDYNGTITNEGGGATTQNVSVTGTGVSSDVITGIFVATDGMDSNPGTYLSPFLTIPKAMSVAQPGDTIFVRGGTYSLSTTISISSNGTSSSKYYLFAFRNERPILDFSLMPVSSSNRGIEVSGTYWHIKGLDIYRAGDNGMYISGSNNIVEFCSVYENNDSGLQLGGGASDNQIINCDSYFNYDPGTNGGNADGFSPKMDVGTGNYFYGCRSWQNSDDGYDGYLRGADGVTTTYENCWCFRNGYLKSGAASAGNGNGFKMGGSDTKDLRHNFILKKCLSFNNRVKGFDQNSNFGSMTLYNCTGYLNGTNYKVDQTIASGDSIVVKNCVALGAYGSLASFAIQATNSWMNPPFPTVTSADFLSVDSAGIRGPRKADGSLPDITFMHLANSRPMVNAGTDVGLPFNDAAPDLGAFETPPGSVPVELTSFFASIEESNVILEWNTATEVNNYGFDIERRTVPSGTWQKISFVAGLGTSNSPKSYAYADNNVMSGRYAYRLKQIDGTGSFKYSQSVEVEVGILPTVFTLEQNYPNPFNPSTVIRFSVAKAGFAKLLVINILGQQVATLFSGHAEPGTIYPIQFNAASLPSGVYLSVLESNGKQEVKKMLLMK